MKFESCPRTTRMVALMTLEYHVPRLLWENLEAVLLAQSKRYVAEMASILRVPEKELLKQVLPSHDSMKVIIQDSHGDSNQCSAFVQEHQLTVYCKKPVAYQSEFCTFHRTQRMMVVEGTHPARIQRIKDRPDCPPLWVQGNAVVQSNGNHVGTIDTERHLLRLYVFDQGSA